jgi:hypothetical protein
MTSKWQKAVIAGLGALLCVGGAAIAASIPTGVISDAQDAVVDGAAAALGSNVYAGDALTTHDKGTLRLRVGSGQLFMLASTDASMTQDHGRMDMLMRHGTAGFSATADDPLEIDTPIGTLRPADASRAFGQVTVASPTQILITSYEGKLLLTRGSESKTIDAGKSYRVTLAALSAGGAAAGAAAQAPSGTGTGSGNNGQWVFDAAIVGGAALGGYFVWRWLCESQSNPN